MNGMSSRYDKLESMLQDGCSEPHNLPLKYLRNITNNFSDERLLGEGGFGTVYKGVLQNGKMIAVKKFNSSIPGVKGRHFENEANHLMQLKHPNVVQLVGWCFEDEKTYMEYNGKYIWAEKPERLLCLEYMPKGNLRAYLSDEFSGLGWDTRYKIIEGICYGLHYLHKEWQLNARIVHRDLKPANILLDNNMVPKIADFGLSRLFNVEKTWTCTISRDGTLGYMSPEYINKGLISTKSDIFSLGVIIVEIVTGRRDYPDETGASSDEFIEMVLKNWSQRNRVENLFGHVSLEVEYQQIRECIQIGLECVKIDRIKRPTIDQIIKTLHGLGSAYSSNIKGVHRSEAERPFEREETSIGGSLTDKLLPVFSRSNSVANNGAAEEAVTAAGVGEDLMSPAAGGNAPPSPFFAVDPLLDELQLQEQLAFLNAAGDHKLPLFTSECQSPRAGAGDAAGFLYRGHGDPGHRRSSLVSELCIGVADGLGRKPCPYCARGQGDLPDDATALAGPKMDTVTMEQQRQDILLRSKSQRLATAAAAAFPYSPSPHSAAKKPEDTSRRPRTSAMATCQCPEPAQCHHRPLLSAAKTYPKLHDRPRPERGGVLAEVAAILCLTGPMVGVGILLYTRSLVSMLFLGRLGELPLAGGSLALGFANITGDSVLSGIAAGMDPICSQAFGAGRTDRLRTALRRTVLLLLAACVPIGMLWVAMHRVLVSTGQDADIAATAYAYILYCLPDLVLQCFLHPIRIYLRAQSVTPPLTYGAAAALLLHVPINFLLVGVLGLGIRGVALGWVWTNLNFLLFLVAYVYFRGMYGAHGDDGSAKKGVASVAAAAPAEEEEESAKEEWWSLVRLCVHSCTSVCLEWWWYEIMVLLCGVLIDPNATVAAMGVLIQTTSLTYIFPHSLGCAVSTRVGHELGARRPERARLVARVGLGLGAALGLVACAFAVSVRGAWARMFTEDEAILKLVAAALPLLGMAELGNCPQTAGCGVLRGSARPEKAARINVSVFYGVGMPVALALAFWPVGLDFRVMWGGMLAAQLVCAALMLRAVLGTDWAEQTARARQLTGGRGGVIGIVDEDKSGHAEAAKAEAGNALFMVADCV